MVEGSSASSRATPPYLYYSGSRASPITRTIRGIRSEVELGPEQGLREACVASCDNVMTIPQALVDPAPIGGIDGLKRIELDRALRYALDIRY